MVNIQLLCVGKLKEKHFSAACAEYQKRLGAFCKLTVTELPEARLPEHPTPTQVEGALAREGEALLAKLPKSTKVIALCVEGVQLSSPALAAQLEQWMAFSNRNCGERVQRYGAIASYPTAAQMGV